MDGWMNKKRKKLKKIDVINNRSEIFEETEKVF